MKKEYNFSKGKRGAVIPQVGKTRITIHLNDVIPAALQGSIRENWEGVSNPNQRCAKLMSRVDRGAPYGRESAQDCARTALESNLSDPPLQPPREVRQTTIKVLNV